jgi:hypothetical protein
MKKKILALAGPKGSGKSTIAKELKNSNPLFKGAQIFSFADPLKTMARALLREDAFLPENKENAHYGLCGKTPRFLLQTLGTEWGRNLIGEGIWAEHMKTRILACEAPLILIDDLRFENEAFMLKTFPHTLIARVQRIGYAPKDGHASEKGLPENLIDLTLPNTNLQELLAFCSTWQPWPPKTPHEP